MEPERTSGTQAGESSSSFQLQQPQQATWGGGNSTSQKAYNKNASSLLIPAAGTNDFGTGKRQKLSIAHQNVFLGTWNGNSALFWMQNTISRFCCL